jgi:pSer/pThr/pTyr-binding forkhead associated (FHA) protein
MSDMDSTRMMGTPGGDRTMVTPAAGAGATMQMPATGFDPMRTAMGGTMTCPVCQATTPMPEQYCGECGFLLTSTPAENLEAPNEELPAAELIDPNDGRRYRLRMGVNTLGRQGTDILVMEGTISRAHARLTVAENGAVTVEDLGSTNGTKVGDRRLNANESVVATHGTSLKFGNWRVTLEVAGGIVPATIMGDQTIVGSSPELSPEVAHEETVEALAALPGPIIAMLQKIDGPADDIPIAEGTITVGRKTGNTVILPQDPFISGRHAQIVTDNMGTYLTDLGSTNGTVVNGQRLEPNERQLLLEGDEVQLGQSKYKFLLMELMDEIEEPEAKDEAGSTAVGNDAETTGESGA